MASGPVVFSILCKPRSSAPKNQIRAAEANLAIVTEKTIVNSGHGAPLNPHGN